MYRTGEYVVYKRDVCKIEEIKKNHIKGKDYYILRPILDKSLKIELPTTCEYLRNIISKEEIEQLIKDIPNIKAIDINAKMMGNEYRNLMNSDNREDLIRIIKTAYARNKERTDNKKKIGDKDNDYFNVAEKYLYNEISISLGLTYDEAKEYIIKEVEKIK